MIEIKGIRLTTRDVEWLRQLAAGKVIKELPGMRSAQAAKNRVDVLRKAFGAYNTCQLVAEALRRKVIE